MLIKMLKHGTGSAAHAAAYVLDEKDHMNVTPVSYTHLRAHET